MTLHGVSQVGESCDSNRDTKRRWVHGRAGQESGHSLTQVEPTGLKLYLEYIRRRARAIA
jgi:hypothetical protein